MPKPSRLMPRLLLSLALLPGILALGACDRTTDRQLAEHAAAETTLGISTRQFAQRFNEQLPKVLAGLNVDDPDHMAHLYQLDATRLHPGKYEYVLETTVGPAQTTMLGTINQEGQLRNIGVLLTDRSQAARDEFLICSEGAARSFVTEAPEKLQSLINRLTGVALNNPGQRMTEVVGQQLLSVEIVPQGLLFQVQPKQ